MKRYTIKGSGMVVSIVGVGGIHMGYTGRDRAKTLVDELNRLDAENTKLREAMEEIISWKDRAGDDRQEVNEMVAIAEASLCETEVHPVSGDKEGGGQ